MRKLTIKQEKFCMAYVETGNASEAYRLSYNAERMKPDNVRKRAFELLQNSYITGTIERLQTAASERHEITVDDIVAELDAAKTMATEMLQPAVLRQVAMDKAKLLGLIVDKHEIADKSADELILNVHHQDIEAMLEKVEQLKNDTLLQHPDYLKSS